MRDQGVGRMQTSVEKKGWKLGTPGECFTLSEKPNLGGAAKPGVTRGITRGVTRGITREIARVSLGIWGLKGGFAALSSRLGYGVMW